MKPKAKFLALSAATLVLLSSCSKDPLQHLSESDSRIYITHADSTVNFGSFHTYSIADSVAVIDNNHLAGMSMDAADQAYLQAINDQMQARNYVLVPKDQHPDIGINVSRIYNTYSGLVSYPDYWGSYYGYWDPYYWGYPGYSYYFPNYYGVYQITEGALSIDFLDLKEANAGDSTLKGIWSGLIRGSGVFDAASAGSQVKALFDQSAYLRSNQ